MPVDHKEIAFEAAIEESLLTHGGYSKATPGVRPRACPRPRRAVRLPAQLPAQDMGQARGLLGAQTEATVLDNLLGALAARGTLDVLRHGFKCYGKQLNLAYFAPAHGMNPDDAGALRGEPPHRHPPAPVQPRSNENSIDLVIGLNGLPVVTAELKNPMTRPDRARRRLAVQDRPRPRRADLPVQEAHAGAFRRRSRRGAT